MIIEGMSEEDVMATGILYKPQYI